MNRVVWPQCVGCMDVFEWSNANGWRSIVSDVLLVSLGDFFHGLYDLCVCKCFVVTRAYLETYGFFKWVVCMSFLRYVTPEVLGVLLYIISVSAVTYVWALGGLVSIAVINGRLVGSGSWCQLIVHYYFKLFNCISDRNPYPKQPVLVFFFGTRWVVALRRHNDH